VQMTNELNNTYANWKSSGGIISAAATTSDILYVIAQPTPADGSNRSSPDGAVSDGGTSNTISCTLPTDFNMGIYGPEGSLSPASVVAAPDYTISSSNGPDPQFVVIPTNSIFWNNVVSSGVVFGGSPSGSAFYSISATSFPLPSYNGANFPAIPLPPPANEDSSEIYAYSTNGNLYRMTFPYGPGIFPYVMGDGIIGDDPPVGPHPPGPGETADSYYIKVTYSIDVASASPQSTGSN